GVGSPLAARIKLRRVVGNRAGWLFGASLMSSSYTIVRLAATARCQDPARARSRYAPKASNPGRWHHGTCGDWSFRLSGVAHLLDTDPLDTDPFANPPCGQTRACGLTPGFTPP